MYWSHCGTTRARAWEVERVEQQGEGVRVVVPRPGQLVDPGSSSTSDPWWRF